MVGGTAGFVHAKFAQVYTGAAERAPEGHEHRYPRWVVPTFITLSLLAAADMVALIFAPLIGSVVIEMGLGLVLAGSMLGMSAAVSRVAGIRGRR